MFYLHKHINELSLQCGMTHRTSLKNTLEYKKLFWVVVGDGGAHTGS